MLQFFGWGVLLQVLAVLHFIRRRPETFWLWVIIFFGPPGALIYIVIEVVPDLGLIRQSFEGFGRRKRIKYLEALVLQNPAAGNYEELGDLYLDEGKFARARECYDRAITPRTADLDPYYRRGMAKVQLGEFASAVEDLEHVTSRDPKYDSHRALGLLAHAFANSGQPDDADRLFRQVTELSTLTETEVNYAAFLAAQNRPVEAREWATRVVAKKATLPRYLQRRERPLFRKASALLKRLPKVALVILFAGLAIAAHPKGPALRAEAGPNGPALRAEERFRIAPDASGQIPYVIADATDGSGYKAGDSQLAVWALEEWERSLGGALRFRAADDERMARLRVRWLPWAEDAALGRMEPLMANGLAIASLDIRPDENRFRPSIKRRVAVDPLMRDVVLYYVCLHEVGHALGLSHSDNPRDVMWPGANGVVTLPVYERYRHHLKSRDDIPHVSWLSGHDIARAKAIWSQR